MTQRIEFSEEMVGNAHPTKADTLNRFINLITAQGDILYGTTAATAARLAKGTALQILRMNAGATAPEWFSLLVAFDENYINGLVLSSDADTAHDINITAGEARDSTDAENMVLASEITKQIDAAWAVGDDAGGIDAGAVAADTIYAIWLIKRSDTGVVDALFSTSMVAPNMPANYDYKRFIGYVWTDGASNIIPFVMSGNVISFVNADETGTVGVIAVAAYQQIDFTAYLPSGHYDGVMFGADSVADHAQITFSWDGVNNLMVMFARPIASDATSEYAWEYLAYGRRNFIPLDSANKIWIRVAGQNCADIYIRAVKLKYR